MTLNISSYLSNEKHLFDYLGLRIYFSKKDQDPLAFYCKSQNSEKISKIVVHLKKGIFEGYEMIDVLGFPPLDDSDKTKFKEILEENLNDIIKYSVHPIHKRPFCLAHPLRGGLATYNERLGKELSWIEQLDGIKRRSHGRCVM